MRFVVGIVIVSHSARLAEGVAELAREMGGPDVPLAIAGGLDLPGQPLGTDAARVSWAIEQVYSDSGVLVLVDLGSAILAAEMALEQLPAERRSRVMLCDAPLVEGALAAAVQARLGADLITVMAEARGALAAKSAQVQPAGPQPINSPVAAAGPVAELRLTVRTDHGLHARPAARLVQTASRFSDVDIQLSDLTTRRGPANAKSINAVTTLGVRYGHEIALIAAGPQADAALRALQALADDHFGDPSQVAENDRRAMTPAPQPETSQDRFLSGLPASTGIAIGPARLLRHAPLQVPTHHITDPAAEWAKLLAVLERTGAQIHTMQQKVAQRTDAQAAEIFEAHRLFLEDEALRAPARRAIFDERLNAAAAWQRATQAIAADYRTLDDEYLRARAADLLAVERQVLLNLLNAAPPAAPANERGILLAEDLTPAETAQLDSARVQAICTAMGGPTSHSAILARTFGIPAVVGLGPTVLAIAEGTPLIVDGETGRVWPDPDPVTIDDYTTRAAMQTAARASAHIVRVNPAITRDGRRVEVAANIGSVADARQAVASGAEGVGLFRTEFLFLDRQTAPDENEQFTAYRAAAEALQGRPLILRTLDVGGDKPLPYLDLGNEANPFLGWRAIRLCLAQPEFFKTQLRAIVRAAVDFPIRIMFPMIATVGEWRAARELLEEARLEVERRGANVPARLETGIMVEIPAAAILAQHFAAEVDFFSIGTNDLTQYTLAAERGNARVAALADALHPAVLTLIGQVVAAAHAHGKWAGVCGELAGDPLAVPVLVGLGVDELSINAPGIPRVKEIIRTLDYATWAARAPDITRLTSAEGVRHALAQFNTHT
ncbi:MAG: phosphoenolpyruvate--protein phosphotransferase [Anaerolineales bacterium]